MLYITEPGSAGSEVHAWEDLVSVGRSQLSE